MKIRSALPGDSQLIVNMLMERVRCEKAPPEMATSTLEQINNSFFCENPKVFCEFVENGDGVPVGLAVWFWSYSTWQGKHGIYVDDLFILRNITW